MRWVIDSSDAASVVSTRRAVTSQIKMQSGGNADEFMVELITGEILAAEWYRHAGAIAVEVQWQDDAAILDVYDQGPALDLDDTGDPLEVPSTIMLRRFAGAIQVEHSDQGNHIRITLPTHREIVPEASQQLWEFAALLAGLRAEKRSQD